MERHRRPREHGDEPGPAGVPDRIVVAIDHLDRLPGPAAVAFLSAAHRLLARPNIVTIVALERGQIASALAEDDPALASSRLDRVVQLSYDLGAELRSPASLVELMLEPRRLRCWRPVCRSSGARPASSTLRNRAVERALGLCRGHAARHQAVRQHLPRRTRRSARGTGDPGGAGLSRLGAWRSTARAPGANSPSSSRNPAKAGSGSTRHRTSAAPSRSRKRPLGQPIGAADARRGLSVARSFGRRG